MVLGGVISHALILLQIKIKFNIYSLYGLLTLIGFQAALSANCGYLLLIELVGPGSRALFCALLNGIDGGIGNTLLPLYYKYIKNWWYLYYFNVVYSAALALPIIFFIPESPKFLIAQRKFPQARAIYRRIARCNRRRMFPNKLEG